MTRDQSDAGGRFLRCFGQGSQGGGREDVRVNQTLRPAIASRIGQLDTETDGGRLPGLGALSTFVEEAVHSGCAEGKI